MDWGEFAERLARELAGLDSHMVLVVHRRAEGSHYVQAFRTGDLLHAEAVSSSVLSAALRFDPVAEDRLADIGWQRPETFGNWSFDLTFSSPPDGFREVATLMTIALRDVQRADSPDELAYESFRGGVFLELTEFGIEPAEAGRATEKHVPPPLPDVPPRLSAVPPVRDPFPEAASPAPGYGSPFGDVSWADPAPEPSVPYRPEDDPLLTTADTSHFPAVRADDGPPATRPVSPSPPRSAAPSEFDSSTGAYSLPPLPPLDDDPLTSGSFSVPREDPYALPSYGTSDLDDPLASGSFSFPPTRPPAQEDPLTSGSFSFPPTTPPAQEDPLTSGSFSFRPSKPPAQDDPLTSGAYSFPPTTPSGQGDPGASGSYSFPPVTDDLYARPPYPEDDPLTSGSFGFPAPSGDPGMTTADVPRPAGPGPDEDPLTSGSFSFPRPAAEPSREDDPLTSGSFAFPSSGDPGVTMADRGFPRDEAASGPGEDTARFAAVTDGPSPAGATLADVPRPDARHAEPPAGDVPVAGGHAKTPNRTALRLAEAKANSDRDGYLNVLEGAELYVTGTVIYSDGVYLRAFTSPPDEPHAATELRALVADWPQPHWQLAVDDGLPSAGYLDSLTLTRLAGGVSSRLVMQKVLPHPLVVHYLEGGYDRVAGYVHRVADVLTLTTPKQLYAALGLGHGRASTFSPDDDAVHVLRWHARFGGPLRTPFGGPDEAAMGRMPGGWVVEHPPFEGNGFAPGLGTAIPEFKVDSQRLPHGAEIYRLDRSGRRVLVALFDADGTRWAAV
ncbi:hypothetical protein EDD29_7094 [Actinocorallia herbida]|uniref:TY-Chap N-terminal domain-containing protein n=1 Tax=Actinocorallia herbida TaxID=58109 RepID=A0A3N1D7A1_9ACTN|nr:hypothetical protein [Actinocorallia herbida]ROO89404.1 hypothetical protein EDD29_7094 [Actinocorallia herbida]